MTENFNKGVSVFHSFDSYFSSDIREFHLKYGEEIFATHGIANSSMDLVKFSKEFFAKSSNLADVTVDSNANVSEKNVMQYNYENNKALMKLNSLYLMHKYIRQNFSRDMAKLALEKVLTGDIFVNDLGGFSMPYSYYQLTPIIIRVNGRQLYMTMRELFEVYKEFVEVLEDREQITFSEVFKQIKYFGRIPVSIEDSNRVCSKDKRILLQNVTENQVIEVLENDRWVPLLRILKHKRHNKLVKYQTKSGNFSLVTEDHPVVLEDGSTKEAKSLVLGDKVCEVKYFKSEESHINVPADLAYLIGFILGDGNVGKYLFYQESNNLSEYDVAISVSKVSNQITIYQKDIKDTHLCGVVDRLVGKGNYTLTADGRKIIFGSVELRTLLAKYFGWRLDVYAKNKALPINILSWNRESKIALLAGLVDSDGVITRSNGSVNIRLTSYATIVQLGEVLNSLGIYFSKRIADNGLYGIYFNSFEKFREYSFKSKLMFEETGIGINRNYDYLERTNEISKIEILDEENLLPDGEDLNEYVFDITTGSGVFYAGGMIQHNCYAFDLLNLVTEGMSFYEGTFRIGKAKRSSSFMALVIQATAYISNQIMGAVSYPSLFVILDWLYRKEHGEDYLEKNVRGSDIYNELKEQWQNLIYSLNFPFRGSQSPFTNLSVLDKGFLKGLMGEYVLPDFTKPNFDSVLELSKRFFEYFTSINGDEGIFTFPVMTIALSVDESGEYIDTETAKWAAEQNCEKALSNVFIDTPNSFSSCPLTPETKVLIKTRKGKIRKSGIQSIFNECSRTDGTVKVWTGNSWEEGRPIKMEMTEVLEIETETNEVIRMGVNHLQPTKRGTLLASSLEEGDLIPFNSEVIESNGGSNITGYVIGCILGDGSFDGKRNINICSSFDKKDDIVQETCKEYFEGIGFKCVDVSGTKTRNLLILGAESFAKRFISGSNALDKGIKDVCLNLSKDFREGIVRGLLDTDGIKESGRLSTSSTKLRDDFITINSSLGKLAYTSYIDDRGISQGKYGDSTNYLVSSPKTRSCKKYNLSEGYIAIKSIKNIGKLRGSLYCFEVDHASHLFTLGNGIITHNCRMRNDFSKVGDGGYQNSFGVGGLSIGSLRVAGLNLPRLAQRNGNMEAELKEDLDVIHAILYSHRKLITLRVEEGYMPLYSSGWIDINKQYSTVGFVGAYEYLKHLGKDLEDYEEVIGDLLAKVEKEVQSWQTTDKAPYNIEQIPAESMAVRLARLDFELGFNTEYIKTPGKASRKVPIYKIYSNQYIPLIEDASIYQRFKIQGALDQKTSGGAILHLNVDDEKPLNAKQFWSLMEQARKTGTKYFGVNYAFNKCEKGHYSKGRIETCPVCGSLIVETFTRVVGFVTSTKNWNKTRREFEYPRRLFYNGDHIRE
jgi:anaerobic ribonucleoside-triphosphate reductase